MASEQEERERLRYLQLKAKAGMGTSPPAGGPTLYEAISPLGSESRGKVGGGRQFANEAADAFSLFGRMVASAPAMIPGGETYPEAVSRTKGKEREGFFGNIAQFAGDVMRDPATTATAPLAPLVPGGGGALATLGRAVGLGATEGVVSAGAHQMEKYGQTGRIDPMEAAGEIGISAATAGLFNGLGQVIKKGKGLARDVVSKFTEVPTEALEQATSKGRFAAAKRSAIETGGDLLPVADDLQNAVATKRADVDRVVREIEQLKSGALTKEITGGRMPNEISPSDFGAGLRETAQSVKEKTGARFGRQSENILDKSGAREWKLDNAISMKGGSAAQNEIDTFFSQFKYDPDMRVAEIGNRVIPEESFAMLDGLYKRVKSANTVDDLLRARRLADQMVTWDANGRTLFKRGSDSDWAIKEVREKFNNLIEDTLRSKGAEGNILADMWLVNNKRYAEVSDALNSVEKTLRMGREDSTKYMGKIKNIGIDKLRKIEELATKDKELVPLWKELKAGYLDDIIRAGSDTDGVDFNKFAATWGNVDADTKLLMVGGDGVKRIESALKKYAPETVSQSTLGKNIVGINPNVQRTVGTLENIGSKAKRNALRELEFLDDILGNEGDQRVSNIAQDAYLAKQLKITPEGKLPIAPDMRTVKSWAGMASGSGTGAAIGTAVGGPIGAAAGAPLGALAGLYLQSPSAAVTAAKILGVELSDAVKHGAGYGTRAGIRSGIYGGNTDVEFPKALDAALKMKNVKGPNYGTTILNPEDEEKRAEAMRRMSRQFQ